MKITIITGSPHEDGTTALLTEKFIEGVDKNAHEIIRFDVAFEDIGPCRACDYCINHDGDCVQKDKMLEIRKAVLEADMVVISTPTYYFGMSAQIKAVIDRFYAFNDELLSMNKESILLAACGDTEEWIPDSLISHYDAICRYLGWKRMGMVYATGVYGKSDVEKTDYPQQAYDLGASL